MSEGMGFIQPMLNLVINFQIGMNYGIIYTIMNIEKFYNFVSDAASSHIRFIRNDDGS